MTIKIEGIVGIAVFALLCLLVWWFFSAIVEFFNMSLGRALSYVVIGGVCYLLGRET